MVRLVEPEGSCPVTLPVPRRDTLVMSQKECRLVEKPLRLLLTSHITLDKSLDLFVLYLMVTIAHTN